MHILEGIGHFHPHPVTDALNPIADAPAEIFLNFFSNHKNDLIEACEDGIVDGVVHDNLVIQANRLQLLDSSAEAGTNARCHD